MLVAGAQDTCCYRLVEAARAEIAGTAESFASHMLTAQLIGPEPEPERPEPLEQLSACSWLLLAVAVEPREPEFC